MNRRDVLIGIVVLVIIIGFLYFLRKPQKTYQTTAVPTPSVQQKLEDTFKITIPKDVDKAELKDVSGGTGSGIATRKLESGNFNIVVLADLPDLSDGSFYEGWLVRGKEGDANFSSFSIGKMRLAKGGYLLEFNSSKAYPDYKGVVITLEKVDDNKPERHILEGNF